MRSDLARISGVPTPDAGLFRPRRPVSGLKCGHQAIGRRLGSTGKPSQSAHVVRDVRHRDGAALARASPTVRIAGPIRAFRWAKTCSTFARSFDLRPLAFAVRAGIGRLVRLLAVDPAVQRPCSLSHLSFSAERYPVSPHTSPQVLPGSISPSRSRLPSFAAASAAVRRRMIPCFLSMPMWVFQPKTGMAMSTSFRPSGPAFAFLCLTVQRASVSFCDALAGASGQISLRRPSLLDRRLLRLGHALARRGDQGRIHDLARPRDEARLRDDLVHLLEQLVRNARLDRRLAEIPKRIRVRNRLVQLKAAKSAARSSGRAPWSPSPPATDREGPAEPAS